MYIYVYIFFVVGKSCRPCVAISSKQQRSATHRNRHRKRCPSSCVCRVAKKATIIPYSLLDRTVFCGRQDRLHSVHGRFKAKNQILVPQEFLTPTTAFESNRRGGPSRILEGGTGMLFLPVSAPRLCCPLSGSPEVTIIPT